MSELGQQSQSRSSLLLLASEFPPGPGGIGTQAHMLAHHLHRESWHVTAAVRQQYVEAGEAQRFNQAQAFEVVPFKDSFTRLLSVSGRVCQLVRLLRRLRPRLAMVSGEHLIYLAAPILFRGGIPYVAIEHGQVPHRLGLRLKSWAFRRACGVICVSDYTRQRLVETGVRPRAIEVIPNGADTERFFRSSAPSFPQALGDLPKDAELLVTVGTLSKRKGQDVVIRALPAILERRPKAHYVMAGESSALGDEIRQLARDLGVLDRVHAPGVLNDSDLLKLLQASHLFVMTSRHVPEGFEGFGIAVIEAALCGVPAVVSGESGLTEAVADGDTGLVVPPDDPAATAGAIIELLGCPQKRGEMGGRAEQRARRHFSWQQVAARYSQALDSFLQKETEGRRLHASRGAH